MIEAREKWGLKCAVPNSTFPPVTRLHRFNSGHENIDLLPRPLGENKEREERWENNTASSRGAAPGNYVNIPALYIR